MAYGISVWDAVGNVMLDTSSIPFNQVDSFLAPAGATISKTYTGMESFTFSVYVTPADQLPITTIPTPHGVSVSANTVTVYGGSIAEYVVVLAQ